MCSIGGAADGWLLPVWWGASRQQTMRQQKSVAPKGGGVFTINNKIGLHQADAFPNEYPESSLAWETRVACVMHVCPRCHG